MKKLIWLVVLILCVPAACQSVADAARASKEKKQGTARRVITDEDMPSTAATGGSETSSDLGDAGWNADLERMRRAYQQVCSASPAGKLTADQKAILEQESKPLKDRLENESLEADKLKAQLGELKKAEQSEVDAAGGDQKRIAEIRERYAAETKPIQARATVSLQRVMMVLKESFGALGDCAKNMK